jgi:cyclic pyranopterin phosphate synthase
VAEGELRDSQGRLIDYLRVSLTERCNLRCIYCMPASLSAGEEGGDFLSFEELLRCCRVLASLGIRCVKITGGEALLRRGTASFIAALKGIPGIRQVTMTSNGLLLERELPALLEAGLDGLNISLNTLDEGIFRRLTRCGPWEGSAPEGGPCGGPERVLQALDAACAGALPVKLNCVPIKGLNGHEVPAIAALARDRPAAVRFIELMPLGEGAGFEPLGGKETAALLESRYGKLLPLGGKLGNGPARYYSLKGFAGAIGFINPLSGPFCGSCGRLRLSSRGFVRPCLASPLGLDLRSLLRSGADDQSLREALRALAARKPERHHFARQNGGGLPGLEMFRIGG